MKYLRRSIAVIVLATLFAAGGAVTAQAAVQDDMVVAVNQQRSAAGVKSLKRDAQLDAVAQEWAQSLRDSGSFAQSSSSWRNARIATGWNSHGENVGFGSSAAVMKGWMSSPAHKANILRPSYTRIGVGYVASGNYWVQIFAGYGSDSPAAGPPSITPSPVGRTGGSARVGAPLTAFPGTWAAGTKLLYQWYVNGQPVEGATGLKFTPGPDATGKRASVAVAGKLTGFSETTRMSALSGIIQALPSISPSPIGRPGGSAKVGTAMTILPGTWALGVVLSFQWHVDGKAVPGATGLKFTPTAQDAGKRATVLVSGSLANFSKTTRMSTPSGIIQALPPVSPSPVGRAGGSARVGLSLTAIPGAWAARSSLTYQWYVNGAAVSGATGVKFSPTARDAGGRASVAVTGTLAGFSPTTRMSTRSGIIQAPFPPVSPSPVGRAGGPARVGLALTAVPGVWAAEASLTYQWYVNGVEVTGATNAKFTPSASHQGGRATVAVAGTAPGYSPVTRLSTPSGIIQAPFPPVSPSPVGRAGGSARVGVALTAIPGAWAMGTSFTYQWYVNGVAVSGATDVRFLPTASHQGGRASVAVTGTLPGFSPTTRMSTSSGIIQPKA